MIMCWLYDDDGMSCCKMLYVGIFFDGMCNNVDCDCMGGKYSNVVWLFDVFLCDKYYSVIYVVGVGMLFVDEIGD